MKKIYDIGGIAVIIECERHLAETLPGYYRRFEITEDAPAAILRISDSEGVHPVPAGEPLSRSFNDLGSTALYRVDGGWLVTLTPNEGQAIRSLFISEDYSRADARILRDDPLACWAVDSMFRIFFAQVAASHGALLVHASAVETPDGNAYFFMGKSGTGKSTHSRLWMETFEGAELLNDDCPLICPNGQGGFDVSGTPWSGKTPCYRNRRQPLGGFARLSQAPANEFEALDPFGGFMALLPGISVITADRELYDKACATALEIASSTRCGHLRCLPDADAARCCAKRLREGIIETMTTT